MTRTHPERGFTLIVTLWLVLVMTTVVLTFAHTVVYDRHRNANLVSGLQSEQTISAVSRYLLTYLSTEDVTDGLPDVEEDDDFLAGGLIGDSEYWLIGRSLDDGADAGSVPEFGLLDEGAKLNLNTATSDMLLALPGMTEEMAAAIIDWRDEDDDPTAGGAESESYLRLDNPYRCKNAPFEDPLELILVYDVDLDLLYGRDRNLNGLQDAWEEDGSVDVLMRPAMPSEVFGLLEYVTVWSRESNTSADGEDLINLNDNDSSELEQLLAETFEADTDAAQQTGAQSGGGRQGGGNAQQITYASLLDYYLDSGLTPDQFGQIDDRLTASEETYTEGLININTAPPAVLACLPGLEADDVNALVAYRAANADNLTSVAWPAHVLDTVKLQDLGPHITTRISQVGADIVVLGPGGRGYRRTYIVVDLSADEPTIVYRRDRGSLGWSLADTRAEQEDFQ